MGMVSRWSDDETGERICFRNPGMQEREDTLWGSKMTITGVDWEKSRTTSAVQPRLGPEIIPLRKAKKPTWVGVNIQGTPSWVESVNERDGRLECSPPPKDIKDHTPRAVRHRKAMDPRYGHTPKCLTCPECGTFEFTRLQKQ
jgi:hypothetical protein